MQVKRSLGGATFVLPFALVALLISSPAGAQTNDYSKWYQLHNVTPSYVEATTQLFLGGDDAYRLINLPFPFTFYESSYNQAYVSTNGYINFLAPNTIYMNSCIPTAAAPNGAIYAFWDDLIVDSAASMWTEVLGTAPNRQFVFEWRNVRFFSGSPGRLGFEIVLSETGAITLQYRDIDSGNDQEKGNSATIGVERSDGNYAFQFSCNKATIGSADFPLRSTTFAIRFSHGINVDVDIKPGGCPNPFNVGSKGVLPVAILGTDQLKVEDIDPQSVSLMGVGPLRWSYEDVGSPNRCNAPGPDGYTDMTFKFDTETVAAALGTVNDGDEPDLQLIGTLRDGTPISGKDVVTIINKGK